MKRGFLRAIFLLAGFALLLVTGDAPVAIPDFGRADLALALALTGVGCAVVEATLGKGDVGWRRAAILFALLLAVATGGQALAIVAAQWVHGVYVWRGLEGGTRYVDGLDAWWRLASDRERFHVALEILCLGAAFPFAALARMHSGRLLVHVLVAAGGALLIVAGATFAFHSVYPEPALATSELTELAVAGGIVALVAPLAGFLSDVVGVKLSKK